jgi:hypothetical protein
VTDITEQLRRWVHDVAAKPASDLMEDAAAEIERLRAVSQVYMSQARYWQAMYEQNSAGPQWISREDAEPNPSEQCLLFTNHLDGFIWIGRRGLLPRDVSHWMYLPDKPSLSVLAAKSSTSHPEAVPASPAS